MSATILCIYSREPKFPPEDQHPDARRYQIDEYYVDALDGRPTLQQVLDMKAPPRRLVPKSLIISRLTDEQLDAALAMMTNRQLERWRAPDRPAVYADDPEAVALLEAVGADVYAVMAP